MDELFRFSVVRAGQTSARFRVSIDASESVLVSQLATMHAAPERRAAARAFRAPPNGIARLDQIPGAPQLLEVLRWLRMNTPRTRADLTELISRGLDGMPDAQVRDAELRLVDLFVSLYLAPPRPFSAEAKQTANILDVADLLRVIELMKMADAADALADAPDVVDVVMSAPLIVPADAAGPDPKLHPVGTIDLLVVKEHITRYDGSDVSRIETIMRGEERAHTQRHTLSNEREITSETEESTETSEERESTEQTKLAQEASKSLSEHIGVKAGVELGYGSAPSFFIRANAGVSYDRATEESSKFAQEVAKAVTTRAATKVSTSTRQVERRRVVETFSDRAKQGFVNRPGDGHIRGVYQFLEQIVTCQVYNYGTRTIYDVTIPDPGGYLRRRALAQPIVANGTSAPPALTDDGTFDATQPGELERLLKPTDKLDDSTQWFHYARLASRYEVVGLTPPPGPLQVEKSYAQPPQPTESRILIAESLEIPSGYRVHRIRAVGMWNSGENGLASPSIDLFVGDVQIPFLVGSPAAGDPPRKLGGPFTFEIDDAMPLVAPGPLALSIESHSASNLTISEAVINVIVEYKPTDETLERWRHETYDRILARYQQLQREFEDARSASTFGAARRSIGRTPLENRALERDELKKAVLALMIGRPFAGYAGTVAQPSSPTTDVHLPAPDPAAASFEHDMATIRFVEQAFEWEHMSFVLYPYFWNDSGRWDDALSITEDDAQLMAFLRAGAARVVVPVRPSFEANVEYFLAHEEPWGGGEMPDASDPRYFDVVDEQRARANAPGTELPIGEPWELRVATSAVWLRGDDALPEWEQPDPKTWAWKLKNGLP